MPDPTDEELALPDVPALRVLAPPPGGIARLRAALDAEPRREARRRWAIAGAALAAIALVWFAVAAPRRAPAPAPDLAVVPRDVPIAAVADPAIATPAVPFYWVSSRPAPELATAEPSPAPVLPAGPIPVVFRR